MLKFMKSPLGITLTAVGAILVLSPEARKVTRRLAVKGTAAVLGLVDQVKDASVGVRHQLSSVVNEARGGEKWSEEPTPIQPEDHHLLAHSLKDSFNVLNDEVIRKSTAIE